MSKGITVLFLTLATYLGLGIPKQADPIPEPVDVITPHEKPMVIDGSYTARSVLVYDIDSDTTVSAHKSSTKRPIASITKIMTGYLALEHLSPDTIVTFSEEAIETDGDTGFNAGESFLLRDVLAAMMMYSSNDAAIAIAEEVGKKFGGRDFNERIALFVRLMNKKAGELGMSNTVFRNPTGLDIGEAPSNFSTADDLRILLKESAKEPLLWESSRDEIKTIYSVLNFPHILHNLNSLAQHIPHFIGGKTGTTDTAGESLVLLFESPLGHSQAFILLGADFGRRFVESRNILAQFLPVLL